METVYLHFALDNLLAILLHTGLVSRSNMNIWDKVLSERIEIKYRLGLV